MLNSKTQKVAYNTIIQIIGKVVTTVLSLVLIAYLTRYLGVAGYGTYTTVFTYVSFWAVIADFGFFWILVREITKNKENANKIFNNVFTFKLFFAVIVFLVCALVGFLIPQYNWPIKIGISIISAGWFWMSLNSTYVAIFQSHLEMYKSAITEVVSRAVLLALVLFGISNNYSLDIIFAFYIIGNFVNFILSYIFGSYQYKFKPSYDKEIWKMIFKESMPLFLLSLIGMIHFKIDTIILSLFKGMTDVGIYGVPYKVLEIIILLPSIFMGNVFPIMTKYFHDKDKRLNNAIQKSFDFLAIMAIPVVVGLCVLSWQIVDIVSGKEFLYASTVSLLGINFAAPHIMIILSISICATFFLGVFPTLFTVIGKQDKQVWPMVIITVVNLIGNLIFIPKYSYVGAAIVNLFTQFMMLAWWAILSKKYLDYHLNFKILPKVFFAGLIMGVAIYYIKNLNLILVVGVGALIYITIILLLKAVNKQDIVSILPNQKN